jgi:hypothetical protein
MTAPETPFSRLQSDWVYGGTLAGLLILVLTPLMAPSWSRAELLVFLILPAYMLHQFEEHNADRFRLFVNGVVFKGRAALSVTDVFLINVPGLWGVLAVVIWLNQTVSGGWGLIGVWLILVNGLSHMVQGVALRRSNPGLWTSIFFFLPLGLEGLATLGPVASRTENLVAFAIAILIHAIIIVRVRYNLAEATT